MELAEDSSDGSSSSSSSDSVLISIPLDQTRRKKLQAQLRLEQQQEKQQQQTSDASVSVSSATSTSSNVISDRASSKCEYICALCERDGDLVVCTGPCVSAFHLRCLSNDSSLTKEEREEVQKTVFNTEQDRASWLCPHCRNNTHVCFHCQQLGTSSSQESSSSLSSSSPLSGAIEGSTTSDGLRPVRKCRALSCGKFYHHDCITQFPLARIAGTHFICPLHTCAACGQSGAKQEAVRCMRCPVAYHTSCLPRNCVQRSVASKRIVCPKHTETTKSSESSQSSSSVVATAPLKSPTPESSSASVFARTGDKEAVPSATEDASEDDSKKYDRVDETEETSVMSGNSSSRKKHSKSAKKEKKKKKKRKKAKKKDKKERTTTTSQDDDDDDEEGEEDLDFRVTRMKEDLEKEDKDTAREGKKDIDLVTTPPFKLDVAPASPATSSLFESPAATSEKMKARLVEVLGNSDDDVEIVGTPRDLAHLKEKRSPIKDDALVTMATTSVINDDVKIKEELPDQETASTIEEMVTASIHTRITSKGSDESIQQPSDSFSSQHSTNAIIKTERILVNENHVYSSSPERKKKTVHNNDIEEETIHTSDDLKLQIPEPLAARSIEKESAEETSKVKDGLSEGEEGDDEGHGGSMTPRSRRRVSAGKPVQALDIEKGDALIASRPGKKKKKKKSKSSVGEVGQETIHGRDEKVGFGSEKYVEAGEGDGDGEEDDEEEAKWVQCDSCKKWRTVPKDLDLDSMPDRWYCNMNTWDLQYSSCDVAEEVVEPKQSKQTTVNSDINIGGSTSKRTRVKLKLKTKQHAQSIHGAVNTGSDGGSSSSSGSAAASKKPLSAKASGSDLRQLAGEEKHKAEKISKKQDKQAKKRKLKEKLKEKYREVKWVQCENSHCGKWRVVPSSIDFSRLPAVWYCHLNTWAPEIASCNTPNPPEVDTFLQKTSKKDTGAGRPAKKVKPSPGADALGIDLALVRGAAPGNAPMGSGVNSIEQHGKSTKSGKGTKTGTPTAGSAGAQSTSAIGIDGRSNATPANAGGNGQGTSANSVVGSASTHTYTQRSDSNNNSASHGKGGGKVKPVTSVGIKKTVLEWAQCEKCNKWRKLPQHIKSSTLPDKWYCSMNHWDSLRANCNIPEEVDQEPLDASSASGSQNWYPLPGQVGGGSHGYVGRFKRGKLSYSELLYASTGQLRKTYTADSSTLSFEYEGKTYYRDDQYKYSSMYVSTASLQGDDLVQETAVPSSEPKDTGKDVVAWVNMVDVDARLGGAVVDRSVEAVATQLLERMDLRCNSTVMDLLHLLNKDDGKTNTITLSVITAALGHLVHRGLVEQIENDNNTQEHDDEEGSSTKRRKTNEPPTPFPALSTVIYYRKVPKRPLKASKCWKLGQQPFEFPFSD